MKIGKLILRNVLTLTWLLLLILSFVGEFFPILAPDWEWLGWFKIHFAYHYILWPGDLSFFTGRRWYVSASSTCELMELILPLIISLLTCIVADFLLRKFLWNKMNNKKTSEITGKPNETN
jgi:hypothetical protein